MSDFHPWTRIKLKALTYVAPRRAGKIATRLFSQSRNAANEYRKPLTPMGAKAIALGGRDLRVENIYLWGEQGDIVLLVHGWGANCSSMFGLVKPLLAHGYRVATFDAPAHGCSPGEYATMAEYVAATRRVVSELGELGEVSYVVAHSLGGIVATAAATSSGEIKKLVTISSPFSLLDVLDIWSGSFMKFPDSIRQGILDQLLADNGVPVSHWDIGLHGGQWRRPVLVIHDTDDEVVSSQHGEKVAAALPDARLFLTSGLGHVKPLMSMSVHQAVVDFIQQPVTTEQQWSVA